MFLELDVPYHSGSKQPKFPLLGKPFPLPTAQTPEQTRGRNKPFGHSFSILCTELEWNHPHLEQIYRNPLHSQREILDIILFRRNVERAIVSFLWKSVGIALQYRTGRSLKPFFKAGKIGFECLFSPLKKNGDMNGAQKNR